MRRIFSGYLKYSVSFPFDAQLFKSSVTVIKTIYLHKAFKAENYLII